MGNQPVPRPRPIPPPPREAVFPPGMAFFYDENVGLYDGDVSTLDLDGSVRAPPPSGVMAVARSPSVASDGMVHIGDEGDDESQISEPAIEIRLSDDEEEDDNAVIIIPDDDRSVISISSDSESEFSDEDISDLDLAAGDENENEFGGEADNRLPPSLHQPHQLFKPHRHRLHLSHPQQLSRPHRLRPSFSSKQLRQIGRAHV